MSEAKKLHFTANAKLGKLIGRELITNDIAAVFELIKNSYDAFATEVYIEFKNFDIAEEDVFQATKIKNKGRVISKPDSEIIISDNGIGMTMAEIQSNWMVIGTTNKENVIEQKQKRNNHIVSRVINGEKGIGRFGCDRIGSKLKMISVGGDGQTINTVIIDWDLFDNHEVSLEEIEIDAISESNLKRRETGLELHLSGLRDQWTCGDILNLYKNLKKLISPFKQEESDFSIFIKVDNYLEQIRNDSLEYATTQIQGRLDGNGQLHYEITDRLTAKCYEETEKAPSFGPVEFRILYLDSAAKRQFYKTNGISLREYGNIKLFRDSFRILPYGEVENDWLGIDNKHAQSVFRTLGTRDIMGYVQITKADNPVLKDATNRQGLNEDTEEFIEFREFIWIILTVLQDYIFKKIKEDAEKSGKTIAGDVQEIEKNIKGIREQLPALYTNETGDESHTGSITKTLGYLDDLESNVTKVKKANDQLSQRITVMEKIVGTESMLYDMLHSIKNKLDALNAYAKIIKLEAQENNIEIDYDNFVYNLESISKIVLAALKRTSPTKGQKEYTYIDQIIVSFINEQRLIYQNISFEAVNLIHEEIYCDIDGFRNVLDNLLSNSRKAFEGNESKRIRISTGLNERQKIQVFFEDNGKGVEEENIPYIFNVSFSRTNGTGIGLSSCLQFMRDCKGDISYARNSSLGGACFVMTFG